MNQIQTIKKAKINEKDIRRIEKQIKAITFLLVKDYFGDQINEVDKKEKTKINQKINKEITKKILQEYKITHIKKIPYMNFIDVMMFISDITIDDLKIT